MNGLVTVGSVERCLRAEEADGWDLVSAVPVTQLGFTSSVWLLFKRPRDD